MKLIPILLTAITLVISTGVTSATTLDVPSASGLLARIEKEGGRKVLSDLWEHEETFEQVTLHIESGDARWLTVAVQLRPFADGAVALSLDYAVARALPKEPRRVLELMHHGFGNICTSPFIEPNPGVAEAYERQALAALASIKNPLLQPLAGECAKGVRLPSAGA